MVFVRVEVNGWVGVAPYPKPGSLLGRFRIKRKLGSSGTGVVYRAEDTLLGVPVALKIFSPSMASDEMYKVISREILLTRRISHQGVCRIHDLHEEKGHRFVTMDLIEGPTLQAVLEMNRKKGLAVPRAVLIVVAAGEAVAAAHMEKIVHRNLKPTNIVVGEDDRVTVLDFGHARAPDMGGQTAPKVKQEELGYFAREVLFGQPATEVADVYSLGAILYSCVAGRTPLETTGAVEQTTGFRGSKPARPSKLNSQVTRALEQVILTAIAASPESRYKNAGEFTAELVKTVEDLGHRSRRPRRSLVPESADEGRRETTGDGGELAERMERATLLFSDIVGITSFFEAHGDIAGRRRIEEHNELLFPIIRRQGGSVLKTIGDAIMASFPDEDDAVDAAIRMQQALDKHNAEKKRALDRICISIGINTGETIVEYGDAYGDAVNVAARVCAKAEGEQILVSEDTYLDMTRNRDIVNLHSRVSLKGKRDLFQLYQVDWLLADDALPLEQEPPDMSQYGEEETADGFEATAVVENFQERKILDRAMGAADSLASAAARISRTPDSLIDRFYAMLGMERNTKTTFALILVAVTLLLLVLGGVYAVCGGGTQITIQTDRSVVGKDHLSPLERP